MQHAAMPYITSHSMTTGSESPQGEDTTPPDVVKLVKENPAIVFGLRGCCMCHVVKLLLLGLGVNPTICDVHEEHEAAVTDELSKIISGDGGGGGGDGAAKDINVWPQLPTVFVGGKLFGGLERVVATHISGELVPILKDAGALWL